MNSSRQMPDSIDAQHWQRLDRQWENFGHSLMERDGHNDKYPNGGHNIKHNPLLRAAIETIRDGYMQLYYEQQKAHSQLRQIEKHFIAQYPNDEAGKKQAVQAMNEAANFHIAKAWANDAEYDLMFFTNLALHRLQKPGFNFSEQEIQEVLAGCGPQDIADPEQKLDAKNAKSIIGSIIGRSIRAYEVVFQQHPDFKRPAIKHTAFKPPETSHVHRSVPLEATRWLDRTHSRSGSTTQAGL